MFKKILLVQPPYTFEKDLPEIVEMPLGLCYIASVLRENGYIVKILDCLAEKYWQKEKIDKKHFRCGLSFNEIESRIKNFNPDVVGVSCLFTIQYPNAKRVVDIAKKLNESTVTVMGGMHATVASEEILKDKNLDFAVRGEAEYSFLDLLNKLNKKNHLKK